MGTDTDTQFLMSSDSGSKVQVGEKEKPSKLTKKLSAAEKEETSTAAVKPGLVRRPSGSSLFGTNEVTNDFVMVDLKTPFAAAPTSADAPGTVTDPLLGPFSRKSLRRPNSTLLLELLHSSTRLTSGPASWSPTRRASPATTTC